MDEIIKAIGSALHLEKKVEYYFTMPNDEKKVLLEGLKKEKNEDMGIFLNAIYADEHNKEIRKIIRRLIFRLRSSGLQVDEPKSAGDPVLKRIEEVRENQGFLTNYGPEQSRFVLAAYEIKKNTFIFLNGEIHFREGLRELMSTPVDRKGLEEIIAAYKSDAREPMFLTEISPAYAAFLVEEGSKHSGRFIDGVKPLKAFVARLRDAICKPDDIYTLPAACDGANFSLQDTLEHLMFAPFYLTWDRIEEDLKEYRSGGGSVIVLPQNMIEEKKTAFLKDLTLRKDIKTQLHFLKRMLEDYAYCFHVMGNYGRYRSLMAITADNKALSDALTFFIRKSLDGTKEKPDERGLIVNPYG